MKRGMETTLKCGVAGVGYLGKHHARLYHALDGAELVGVFEPNDDAANAFVPVWLCPVFGFRNWLPVMRSVWFVQPTGMQKRLELIDHGCHLLVEKPLCLL